MTYQRWMQQVDDYLSEAGCGLADLAGRDWATDYDEGVTPDEAADAALRDLWYMSPDDPEFYDYMAHSDADPGL